ncbi:serine hydrolase domain-containing protein [Kineosporia mesophila]|uniref:Serine hydrolase domain-containing protein n=1 Tax=Kineosporia mesophila TaxID=566012 RepID=A0ABP7AAN1_9ACTN|nr:serine hydrolase domain-containing protein [Kineosporia mesophila]MCD5351388.1 beta-lactamase family protein [Kineosporia mesophila]
MVRSRVLNRRRSTVLGLAALLAGVALTGGPASAAPASELQRTAQGVVDAGAVGYLVRVNDGDRVRTATAGLADRATGRRLKNHDQYEAGSQTKTFVAVLVLQLVAERQVELDAPIEKYLPGVVPNGANITVRMLLQHTSGLFNYTADEDLINQALTEPYTPIAVESVLKAAFSHPPNFAPGTDWSYSNTGYIVLGELLKKVTGRALTQLVDRRIARPLHLHDTYFADPFPGSTGPGYAHGYIADLSVDPPEYVDTAGWTLSWAGSAGAIISTTRDLSTFYSALLSGKVLPKAQLAQMRKTKDDIEEFGGLGGYGLGLYWMDTPCGRVWGHDGATLGNSSTTFTTADGGQTYATDTTTRLYAADPADPRLQTFAFAYSEAQVTAMCGMFGLEVPSAVAKVKASVWPQRLTEVGPLGFTSGGW